MKITLFITCLTSVLTFLAATIYIWVKGKGDRHNRLIIGALMAMIVVGASRMILLYTDSESIIIPIINQILIIFFVICVTRFVVQSQERAHQADRQIDDLMASIDTDRDEINLRSEPQTAETIWAELEKIMTIEKPWRNHDLKLDELAHMVRTNRTTLSSLIHTKIDGNYHDYLANYRIDAFCKYAEEHHVENITELLSEVGFKSSSTAFKHFKRIHNTTPYLYVKSIQPTYTTPRKIKE